ncbi:hypothetical protein PYCCODRAFT_635629 [Trametes coccinea BRFM310]|uniref:Uncharacterized protein n=1 Tax=Trametes coccinea (strain BRFM310) TaxID=1353009 RepID=A0A1Y2II45_TRAC3|nr:hypothetical protein PYCCODRAFT_635629 [Trametes coccinea BRFM310]
MWPTAQSGMWPCILPACVLRQLHGHITTALRSRCALRVPCTILRKRGPREATACRTWALLRMQPQVDPWMSVRRPKNRPLALPGARRRNHTQADRSGDRSGTAGKPSRWSVLGPAPIDHERSEV